jgi:hypothetical protein
MRSSEFAAVAFAMGLLLAATQWVAAEELTSPRLEQLRAEVEMIRRDGAALGYAESLFDALNNLNERVFVHHEQLRRIDRAIEVARGTAVELRDYSAGEEARRIYTREDAYDEIYQDKWEIVSEVILAAAGKRVAAAILGGVTLFADIMVPVTKKVWKEMDLAEYRRLIEAHDLHTEEFQTVRIVVELARGETLERIRGVEAARAAYRAKMAEIGAELERLRTAAAAEKSNFDTDFHLAELADLTRGATSLNEAFRRVRQRTGLDVEKFPVHLSARQASESVIYYCEPNGRTAANIDGTHRYSELTNPCLAGIHAGVLSRDGGFVRIRHLPADSSFRLVGSTRNGFTSTEFNPERPTFVFVPVLQ